MAELWNTIVGVGVEAIVIIVGAFLSYLIHKAAKYVHAYAKERDLSILDRVATNAVNMAENLLYGKEGKEKRQYAVEKALQFLDNKGVQMDEDEVISAVEKAVAQLRQEQKII